MSNINFMTKKSPAIIFWIPIALLCCILAPMNLRVNTLYIEFALPVVGFFALWLCLANFLFYEPKLRSLKWGLINLILVLFYNPIISNLSLSFILALKNHRYLILLNLSCALVFFYQWWQLRGISRKA